MKRLALLSVIALLAGCGGGTKSQPPGTTVASGPDVAAAMATLIKAQPALAGTVRVLFEESRWAVVQSSTGVKAHAVTFRLVGGKWHPDQTGKVKVEILGPEPGAHAQPTPQIAIQASAKTDLADSGLWIDGTEIQGKGGGTPTVGTIYGAPTRPLKTGVHVAVGYARTATSGTAVAWLFRVG